jgi:hypothetical protein
MYVVSILVLIGMWFERFNIIVPSLGHDFYPYTWGIYVPTLTDSMIVVGSFAWFFLLFLGFIKLMPSLSIVEVKETIPHPVRDGTRTDGARRCSASSRTWTPRPGRSAIRARGMRSIATYSPVPLDEFEEALTGHGLPRSPVRLFTLVGALTGTASGFALTIWTALKWNLITGGKPVVSIPPFVIIAFEMTILLGGLCTLLGLLVTSRLPSFKLSPRYDPRFSEDRFGIEVTCEANERRAVEDLLRGAGAERSGHEVVFLPTSGGDSGRGRGGLVAYRWMTSMVNDVAAPGSSRWAAPVRAAEGAAGRRARGVRAKNSIPGPRFARPRAEALMIYCTQCHAAAGKGDGLPARGSSSRLISRARGAARPMGTFVLRWRGHHAGLRRGPMVSDWDIEPSAHAG